MLAQKIAKNFLVSSAGRFLSFVMALITTGYVSRYLGRAGFGDYSTVLAFVYIFTVFADLGLYQIALRGISEVNNNEKRLVGAIFSLRLLWGALIFLLAPVVVIFSPYNHIVKVGVAIAALGLWFLSNTQVLISIFQKYLKTEFVAYGDVLSRTIQLVLVIIFIRLNQGFYSIVWAVAISACVNFLFVFAFSKRLIDYKISIDIILWKKIVKESFPLAIAGILTMVYFKLDIIMLSLFKSAEDVGIYGLAYKVLESLIFFPAMFVGLVMPQMIKFLSLGNNSRFNYLCQKTQDLLFITAVPLVVGGWFLSKPIALLLGGEDFLLAANPLNILLAATSIIFFGSLFSSMIIAFHKQKTLSYIYSGGAIFNVVANLIVIPQYSYMGAAATTLTTEIIVTGLMVWAIYNERKSIPSWFILKKVMLAVIIMSAFLYVAQYFGAGFSVMLFVGVIVYIGTLYMINGFHKSDLMLLISKHEPSTDQVIS
ncbi:MAG: hypothetical protein COU81_01410 [Candidatus Portnoybacteria bacterium CG10_big_fil_rev_8_21_14_0_10_36_7]|uniref:Uncharacterized protein n=1 Tax=Candidatus Portnoybacteria bacterium CG10_big_fil_rev_8_21_14_0_10_36_7 TaxID=1974812 RepID=A0A2M8KEF6_9BACT|nr:MAG: hypothetical protein COU81_01410 [Candidatus Portnoybacteria bacterium CG10_big_fil_rev_8_21_14_0_10_36_7]